MFQYYLSVSKHAFMNLTAEVRRTYERRKNHHNISVEKVLVVAGRSFRSHAGLLTVRVRHQTNVNAHVGRARHAGASLSGAFKLFVLAFTVISRNCPVSGFIMVKLSKEKTAAPC